MSRSADRLAVLIGTAGTVGYIPLMPGTFGSLVGVGLFIAVSRTGLGAHLVLTAGVTLAGIWAAGRCAVIFAREDPPRVVVDEVAGYLLAMTAVPATWGWVLAGFVLFRVFDILKPPPAGWADRELSGGLGIMLDDLAAGAYTWVTLQALLRLVR